MHIESLGSRTKTSSRQMTGLIVLWTILGSALQHGWAGPLPAGRYHTTHPIRVARGLCSCPGPCRLPLPAKARRRAISSALPPGSRLLAAIQADLDADGSMEWACITRLKRRFDLVILERRGRALVVAGRNRVAAPWHMELGDVDGDGRPEILVGVQKRSPLDPVIAKRPFFYFWDGQIIRPKWLGSRLARRFSELALADLDADGVMELYAVEPIAKGKVRVSAYRWRGFGFRWLGAVSAPPGKWHICRSGKGLFLRLGHNKRSIRLARDHIILSR